MAPDPSPAPSPDSMEPDPAPEPSECAVTPGCEPGDPSEYDFDVPATFVNGMTVEEDKLVGGDVDGDGRVDNALGGFLGEVGRLVASLDINQQYVNTIQDGRLVFGLTWPSLTVGQDIRDVQDVELHFLPLSDVDGDPLRTDRFRALEEGFIEGSRTPRSRFAARIEEGVLTTEPGQFDMPFPIGQVILDLSLENVTIEGKVVVDELGIALDDVGLSGGFSVDKLVGLLNDFLVSDECSCADIDAPLISLDGCLGEADASACVDEKAICASLVASCGLLGQILLGNADLDIDGDGTNDALSVYLRMDGVGTRVEGVQRQ